VGSLLPLLVKDLGWPVWAGLGAVLALALALGLAHGLLIAKLRLSPFVVTLCGLFMYRGLARYFTGDATQGFGSEFEGLKYLAKGKPFTIPPFPVDVPMPFVILFVLAAAAAVFLNLSVHGRYLLALGRNEQAARYSGINTDRIVIAAYVISAGLAGFAGVLLGLDVESVQPSSHGISLELYAIAGAVLGGCSLRGGEGSILGVVLGTALVILLRNAIGVTGIPTQIEFAVIGAVILAGVAADEVVKRVAAARRAGKETRTQG
jgi:ribose transport system permease protein